MGIDWEEILDAEGEDLESAYTDSLPDSEPYPNDYAEPMRENRLTPEEIKKITLERKERWKKYKEEYEEFFGEEFELELADDVQTPAIPAPPLKAGRPPAPPAWRTAC